MFCYFFLQVCFIYVFLVPSWASPDAGPADIKFKYAEKCKGFQSSLFNFEMSAYTVQNKKIVMNMSGTYRAPISDDWGVIVNGAVRRNGGWRPNFVNFKINKGLCTMLKTSMPKSFEAISTRVGAPEPHVCPLPAGTFDMHVEAKVTDMRRIQTVLNMGIMPYGELKLQVNFTRFENVVFCMFVYVEIMPKVNKRQRNG